MAISPDIWSAASRLLDEGLDLAEGDRQAWLLRLGQTAPHLAPLVRELLAAHAKAGADDLLDRLPQMELTAGAEADSVALGPGQLVGPYRLLRQLGVGGMGVVWLAERTDGQLKRPVALKLPLLALQLRAHAERFARERDILATLTHPNIARLYDAGITSTGQPFLALEYVDGKPITTYCDEKRLGLRARVGLFIQVLRAVQYAHAHLVIHRDLKPSNILVTPDGEVRLLDFGVAKLIGGVDAGDSDLTRDSGRAHTTGYASPEQIAGGAINIASDIYSLGVLGYELLAGARPYRAQREGNAQLEEAILHADPLRPSLAVGPEAAAMRGVANAKRLAALLAGDLDTILLKALKKRPEQRYSTVDALTDDLERYLHGDAIDARADSALYRAQRLISRNRVAFGAAATIAVALIAGTTVALWQAREAQHEAARANAVQQFVVDLFRANTADQTDPLRARQTTVRELLDRGAARIVDSLTDQPQSRLALLDTLGGLYAELGMWAEASDLSAQQLVLARSLYGERDVRVANAIIVHVRSLDNRDGAPPAEIGALLDEAERILDAHGDQASLARAHLHELAAVHHVEHSIDRARQHAARAVDLYRNTHPNDSGRADALAALANAMLRQGDGPQALATIDEALRVARKQALPEYRLIYFLSRAGEINSFLDNSEPADALLREALAIAERINGPRHTRTMSVRRTLARHLAWTSRTQESLRLVATLMSDVIQGEGGRESYLVQEAQRFLFDIYWAAGDLRTAGGLVADAFAAFGPAAPQTFERMDLLLERGMFQTATGQLGAATDSFREAAAILDLLQLPRGSLARGILAWREAERRLATGDVPGARALFEEQLGLWHADRPGNAARRGMLNAGLVEANLAMGDPDAAAIVARDALQELARSPGRSFLVEADARVQIAQGRVLMAQQRCGDALPYLEQGAELYARVHAAESPWRATANVFRVTCLIQLGRLVEARPLLTEARAVLQSYPQLGAQFTAPLGEAIALANGTQRVASPSPARR